MLGPLEYEVRLAGTLNGWLPEFPPGTELVEKTEHSLRYQVQEPDISNPILIRQLQDHQFGMISVQEVSRSLEQAYLQAVSQNQ